MRWEAVVLAVDDERNQIQALPEDGRAAFADLPSPVERVSRVVDAGVEPGIGDILIGAGEIGDRVAFGVDRGCQDAADAQGQQRGIEFLDASGKAKGTGVFS